jgi:integrase
VKEERTETRFAELLSAWTKAVAEPELLLDVPARLASLAGLRVEEITGPVVRERIESLAHADGRRAAIALRVVKRVLADARERGLAVDEVVFRLAPPWWDPLAGKPFLSWEDVADVAAAASRPYGNLVLLAGVTGLSRDELFGLTERSLDLDGYGLEADGRRVALSAYAVQVLVGQLAARPPTRRRLVFPAPDGEPLEARWFRDRVFAPACRRVGLDGTRFGEIRTAYAVLQIRRGTKPEDLRRQLGQAAVGATLELYDRFFRTEAAKWAVDRRLVEVAQRYGLKITSGCRRSDHNRVVGGAHASHHLAGRAIDLAPAPGVDALAAEIRENPHQVVEFFYDPLGWYVIDGCVEQGAVGRHVDHVHLALR